jgi:spermidine synthase
VVRDCFTALSEQFARADRLWTAIATYPGAVWTFGIGTKGLDPRVVRRRPAVESRLYDVDAHEWFFVPEPVRRKLLGV